MNSLQKRLVTRLHRQCDDLAVYSHHLSTAQCDTAFLWIRDIVSFIKSKSNSEEGCNCALRASDNLEGLIDIAVNEDWMGHTSTEKSGV